MTVPATSAPPPSRDGAERWKDALSRDELHDLLRHRDLRSALSLACNWGLIGASLAVVARWPHPLTVLLALLVIGARQLGLGILMHDAAHRALFSSRGVNDRVGSWLCGHPVWADLATYRPYHLQHHAKNYTPDDPDLALVAPFPVTRASLRRKIVRDLTGRTGYKRAKGTLARDLGLARGAPLPAGAARRLTGVAASNALLFLLLWSTGHPELYLLWAAAWMTTFQLVTRIRAIAEHALAPDPEDPLRNTRTTLASWWERLLLAPNRVNFHLEHHLLMTVPHYNLPRVHRLLRERGVLGGAWVARGYLGVLRDASARPA